MEVTVTKPIEDFIQRQIAKGYRDSSEATRQALSVGWTTKTFILNRPTPARKSKKP